MKGDGKHAFSMIGVHLIEATILWRGGFGGGGGAPWVSGVAGLGPICQLFKMFLLILCLSFLRLFVGVHFCAFWAPRGCKRGSKEAPGSSFWTAEVDKTCPRPWM